MPQWDDIIALADRYDCLALAGGMMAAMQLADRVRAAYGWSGAWQGSEAQLQACLSFECRTWQHCCQVPQGSDLDYLGALYERVRATALAS